MQFKGQECWCVGRGERGRKGERERWKQDAASGCHFIKILQKDCRHWISFGFTAVVTRPSKQLANSIKWEGGWGVGGEQGRPAPVATLLWNSFILHFTRAVIQQWTLSPCYPCQILFSQLKETEQESQDKILWKSLSESNWPYTHNMHVQLSTDWHFEGENAKWVERKTGSGKYAEWSQKIVNNRYTKVNTENIFKW